MRIGDFADITLELLCALQGLGKMVAVRHFI